MKFVHNSQTAQFHDDNQTSFVYITGGVGESPHFPEDVTGKYEQVTAPVKITGGKILTALHEETKMVIKKCMTDPNEPTNFTVGKKEGEPLVRG